MSQIYLDYAATTPIDPRVVVAMHNHLQTNFGNPASLHRYGEQARSVIELAREQVAQTIGAEASQIIWTSGATESNNLAIKGAAYLYSRKGKHIITLKTEHKAVLDTCQHLEKEGYQVSYLAPLPNGLIDLDTFQKTIRPDTILVSVMQVNNEIGVIQNLEHIAEITAERGILFHVDAAQSIGKVSLNMQRIPIDLLSLSAHKIYGPKGIGALYLRKKPRVRVMPLIHGGGHEQGMRSGTLPTHQIVGMGMAFHLAQQEWQQDYQHIVALRNDFLKKIQCIPAIKLNVDLAHVVPHILNLRFENTLAEAMLAKLPQVATSTASACQGKGIEGSYVLRALGLTAEQAKSSVRFSFGRFTSLQEVQTVSTAIYDLYQ